LIIKDVAKLVTDGEYTSEFVPDKWSHLIKNKSLTYWTSLHKHKKLDMDQTAQVKVKTHRDDMITRQRKTKVILSF
jgi:hypothetical protein